MATRPILLITGGNTGLGFETVKALYSSPKKAYTILLGSRNLENAHSSIRDLKAEIPESQSVIDPVQIDIDDDDSISNLYQYTEKTYGRLDILINNAGNVDSTDLVAEDLKC
jgi:NAD(P)-dependent dehydrogenase (short-subunit alcohol dehydrogenase family)